MGVQQQAGIVSELVCENRVLDGPASGGKGSKGGNWRVARTSSVMQGAEGKVWRGVSSLRMPHHAQLLDGVARDGSVT